MVVVYVIGIPAPHWVFLYDNREALTKNIGREEDGPSDPFPWLDKLEQFYYEVIEYIRRMLLSGAFVFI